MLTTSPTAGRLRPFNPPDSLLSLLHRNRSGTVVDVNSWYSIAGPPSRNPAQTGGQWWDLRPLKSSIFSRRTFSPMRSHREHNVRVTPKRAFWEAFATVCLPSLLLWSVFAYLLRSKLNLPYAEALPIYLFLAVLPMPLAFPVYRRYLRCGPRNTKTLSPKLNIALAIFFAVVGILHAAQLPRLLRSHKNGWDVVFHAAIATGWLSMSIEYVRRAATKQPPTAM